MYSKFHPPRILFCLLYFIIPEIRGGGGGEKGIYSKFHPPRIFFCFSLFILVFEAFEAPLPFVLTLRSLRSPLRPHLRSPPPPFVLTLRSLRSPLHLRSLTLRSLRSPGSPPPFVLPFEAFEAPFVLTFEAFEAPSSSPFEAFEAFVLTFEAFEAFRPSAPPPPSPPPSTLQLRRLRRLRSPLRRRGTGCSPSLWVSTLRVKTATGARNQTESTKPAKQGHSLQ